MAGNKNSGNRKGRPSRLQMVQQGDLLSVCTTWIIENFHTFDKETKIKVALQIASKGIVQKVEANVNYTAKTIMDEVQKASQANRVSQHVQ